MIFSLAGKVSAAPWSNCLALSSDECACFSQEDQRGLAEAVVELEKCQIALGEKTRFVDEQFIRFAGQPGPAWWQEPHAVLGGMVVSFSLGAALAMFAIQQR